MLSAIVITKNEEQMIEDCLLSLKFCDELIVVDTGNTDKTNEIAKQHGAKVIFSKGGNYAQWRNSGLKVARGEWVIYVDADERVTPLLREEIRKITSESVVHSTYAIGRLSVILGKQMNYGGWGSNRNLPHNSWVIRLFRKSDLSRYEGELHEQPVFTGSLGYLENLLVHITHRDLSSMLEKTIGFTDYEARLRLLASHPLVVTWRFVRVMLTEFWLRFIRLSAWRDGVEGIIDGMFQVFNMFVIYARLWEVQTHLPASAKQKK